MKTKKKSNEKNNTDEEKALAVRKGKTGQFHQHPGSCREGRREGGKGREGKEGEEESVFGGRD